MGSEQEIVVEGEATTVENKKKKTNDDEKKKAKRKERKRARKDAKREKKNNKRQRIGEPAEEPESEASPPSNDKSDAAKHDNSESMEKREDPSPSTEKITTSTPTTTKTTTATNHDLPALEIAYQQALQAFKADKTNKDLRRAKTAAKRAWDAAILATAEAGAEPIVCRNCSHLFLFCQHEEFEAREWDKPTQCKHCTFVIGKARSQDRSQRDEKQNMCYDFQKMGVCSRGDRCKFSHAKDHVGKTKPVRVRAICFAFEKGETCPHGDQCRFRHEKEE